MTATTLSTPPTETEVPSETGEPLLYRSKHQDALDQIREEIDFLCQFKTSEMRKVWSMMTTPSTHVGEHKTVDETLCEHLVILKDCNAGKKGEKIRTNHLGAIFLLAKGLARHAGPEDFGGSHKSLARRPEAESKG